MKDQFVPYELALQMKDLGFDEMCFGFYQNDKSLAIGLEEADMNYFTNKRALEKETYSSTAPLWQQAFDWFSDKKGLEGTIKSWKKEGKIVWMFSSHKLGDPSTYRESYGTKQESLTECLKKLIELCKKN